MKVKYLLDKIDGLKRLYKNNNVILKIDNEESTLGIWVEHDSHEISIYFEKGYTFELDKLIEWLKWYNKYDIKEFRRFDFKPGFIEINPDDVDLNVYVKKYKFNTCKIENLYDYMNHNEQEETIEDAVVIEIVDKQF